MYHFDWPVFLKYIWPPTAFQDPLIRNGLIATIVVSIVAQALGVVLGLFAALGKMSKFAIFRWIAEVYIWYFRGTPLLVQMALLFFGLGVTHIYDFPDIIIGAVDDHRRDPGRHAGPGNQRRRLHGRDRPGRDRIDRPGPDGGRQVAGDDYGLAMQRIVLPRPPR